MPKSNKKEKKVKCSACNNKGFYTQMFGFKWHNGEELPTIHKIACPICNWRNERKLENVLATMWSFL